MTSPLERWYRRLLHAYPGAYRRVHGEEILATLLEGARPGQRLPDPKEAASLLAGGLRARAVLAGGGSSRRLWASGLWLGALLLVAENAASALLAQWQELSWAWSNGDRYQPSVLVILPILGFVALLRGRRRTGLVLVAATAAVAASSLGFNIGANTWATATWSSGLLARYLLPAAILAALAWRSPVGQDCGSWRWLLLPVGLATVPALVNASQPSPALLLDPIFWQLIGSWPVSGLLAVILSLAALALSRMDPRLPIAVSVYLSPLVASALGVAIAGGGTAIVAMVWSGLVALLLRAAVLGSRRLLHA
jgi:hypothetical protein